MSALRMVDHASCLSNLQSLYWCQWMVLAIYHCTSKIDRIRKQRGSGWKSTFRTQRRVNGAKTCTDRTNGSEKW